MSNKQSRNSIFFQDHSINIAPSALKCTQTTQNNISSMNTNSDDISQSYSAKYKKHLPQASASSISSEASSPFPISTNPTNLNLHLQEPLNPDFSSSSSKFKEEKRQIYNLESIYRYKMGSSTNFGFSDQPDGILNISSDNSPAASDSENSPCSSLPEISPQKADQPSLDTLDPTKKYLNLASAAKLGEGRFSRVFSAQILSFDSVSNAWNATSCAVKRYYSSSDALELASIELLILIQASHRNIPKFLGLSLSNFSLVSPLISRPSDCLDLVESPSIPNDARMQLCLELAEHGPVDLFVRCSPKELLQQHLFLKWAFQLAKAIEHLHSIGYIHHDIKPNNILLTASLDLLLTDFGHSRLIPPSGCLSDGIGRGTTNYMAPELFSSSAQYDKSIDIYSYGATLFALISNAAPFYAALSSAVHLLVSIKKGFFECGLNQWRYRNGSIFFFDAVDRLKDSSLVELIERCTQLQPANRPQMPLIVSYFEQKIKEFSF